MESYFWWFSYFLLLFEIPDFFGKKMTMGEGGEINVKFVQRNLNLNECFRVNVSNNSPRFAKCTSEECSVIYDTFTPFYFDPRPLTLPLFTVDNKFIFCYYEKKEKVHAVLQPESY